MTRGTVFVVDDDAAIRRALERLIRSVGLEVETFASAKELLERDPPDGPACIVTDVRMPGLSGLDLLKERSSTGLDLPVIFMTGHGTVPMSVRAMKAGAVDFLQKPVDDQVLLDTIHKAIEQDTSAWGVAVKVKDHIAEVMAAYGDMSAYDLERLACSEEPWNLARTGLRPDE